MKLLLVLVASDCLPEVQRLIEEHDVHAYTEVPNILGAGRSGRHLGTRAFPGTSSMLLTILPAAEAERLSQALVAHCAAAGNHEIRVFALDAQAVA
jgi:hypothetical protein